MLRAEVTLRDARREDAEALWSIRTRAIREVCSQLYSAELIAAWSAVPMPRDFPERVAQVPFVVAQPTADETVVGFGALALERSEVAALFVDPAQLRSGVGRALLAELERRARAGGLRALTLFASLNSVAFYEAAGFWKLRAETFRHSSGLELPSIRMGRDLI